MCFEYFVSCVHVRFYFSLPLIFALLAASISHFLTAASMFFFLRNSSPLFSITRSSSVSVIHVSVNTKNNPQKGTTLLLSGLFLREGERLYTGYLVIFKQNLELHLGCHTC